MTDEIARRASFDRVNYGQVWEDADLLLSALAVQPGERCLSIASAGDNALALLLADPAEVVAIDLNPYQIACLELRIAAYRALDHAAFLELYGAEPSRRRADLYARCRPLLGDAGTAAFWDGQQGLLLRHGLAGVGRLERYLRLFRRLLRLVQGSSRIEALLAPRTRRERARFYREAWDSWRWRLLFRLFFSRCTMQALGREPAFFAHAEADLARHLLARSRHALTELDPSRNPYLNQVLTGRYGRCLPLALRPESFGPIRARLDRLTYRRQGLEEAVAAGPFDRMNLSDVFEYKSEDAAQELLRRLRAACPIGGRIAFWNMLVPRQAQPEAVSGWRPLSRPGAGLLQQDKAFFYSAFHLLEAV